MKRTLTTLALAALLAVSIVHGFVGPAEFYEKVSATATNRHVTFGFEAVNVLVINDGASEVYVTFASKTSTVQKFELKSGESVSPAGIRTEGVSLICATSETATVRVLALGGE